MVLVLHHLVNLDTGTFYSYSPEDKVLLCLVIDMGGFHANPTITFLLFRCPIDNEMMSNVLLILKTVLHPITQLAV